MPLGAVLSSNQLPSNLLNLIDRDPRFKMKAALLLLIKSYRLFISPLTPPVCRFEPTCSCYALEAIERFGPLKGSGLAIRRVTRCHPFHPGGYDPVPEPTNPHSPLSKKHL